MTTQTETSPQAETETGTRKDAAKSESRTDALDWAVFGCLAAGAVGIIKALNMDRPFDVAICLLASVAAFSVVLFVHLRKQ